MEDGVRDFNSNPTTFLHVCLGIDIFVGFDDVIG